MMFKSLLFQILRLAGYEEEIEQVWNYFSEIVVPEYMTMMQDEIPRGPLAAAKMGTNELMEILLRRL